jgi:thiol-disulfide isomerase/thioredoxin
MFFTSSKWSWLAAVVLILVQTPAQAALVMGSLRNSNAGERVEIQVPHYYIDGKMTTQVANLDAQGRFQLQVKMREPQLAYLVFNESKMAIFLADDDTLSIQSDAFQFPLVVYFGGKGGANNTVLQQYFKENPLDFNEFNNIRYKIGQWWGSVEETMNSQMENLGPADFRAWMDRQKTSNLLLLEQFSAQQPGQLSPVFSDWLTTQIVYSWAYHLTFYGQVYGGRHFVQSEFFDYLFEAPTISQQVGSDWYRQFLLVLLARQQAKTGQTEGFWSGLYQRAGELLEGKSLAFFRSEIILLAFSKERFKEILPLYRDFLENNKWVEYDPKVEDLYQKMARTALGAAATDFSAPEANGSDFALSHLRGKIVYLNFWASWCGSCLRKMEFFNEFEPELNTAGVVIVNVSIDDSAEKWQNAVRDNSFKGHHLLASMGRNQNIATAFNVEAIPQYFILQRNGTFAEKAVSNQPNDIRDRLLELSQR